MVRRSGHQSPARPVGTGMPLKSTHSPVLILIGADSPSGQRSFLFLSFFFYDFCLELCAAAQQQRHGFVVPKPPWCSGRGRSGLLRGRVRTSRPSAAGGPFVLLCRQPVTSAKAVVSGLPFPLWLVDQRSPGRARGSRPAYTVRGQQPGPFSFEAVTRAYLRHAGVTPFRAGTRPQ